MTRIVIAGAGLAGLSCALVLRRYGHEVTVFEKRSFPFHKVCGEYVSNEVLPFLSAFNIDVSGCGSSRLSRLKVTGPRGAVLECPLDLGGFGLSRYRFDELLYEACRSRGIAFHTGTKVHDIRFRENAFHIALPDRNVQADLVIGAWGKRSNLDQKLDRRFFGRRSTFMAVKYHVRAELPKDQIQLDLFPHGYSGICAIEDGQYSLCYLCRADSLRRYGGSIRKMEREVLFSNPALRAHLEAAEYLSETPRVISQISFESKPLTAGHVLFCGDSAGMISPLFGNGMAMAIRSGKFLAELIHLHLQTDPGLLERSGLERLCEREWRRNFRFRIGTGRLVQNLFTRPFLADAGIRTLGAIPGVARMLVKNSHGRPF